MDNRHKTASNTIQHGTQKWSKRASENGLHRPHRPENSAYYQCVEDHFEDFEQVYEERFEWAYGFHRLSSDFCDVFGFNSPSTQGYHGRGHLAFSLFRKLENFHFRIEGSKLRNNCKKIHSIKPHTHHIKGFVLKKETESHSFFLQTFETFSKFFSRYPEERVHDYLRRKHQPLFLGPEPRKPLDEDEWFTDAWTPFSDTIPT